MQYCALRTFLLFLLLIWSASAGAQDIESLFRDGNGFYQEGDYEAALDRYQVILDQGFESGELYYNMGNVHYKNQNVGKAVLYYEKARSYFPDNEDLLHNLELTSLLLTDKITPIADVFYVRYWNIFRGMFGITLWKTLFFTAWFFAAGQAILLLFLQQSQVRIILRTGLIFSGVLIALISTVLFSDIFIDTPGSYGIVMAGEITAYSAPTDNGMEVFLIHEGTKVKISRTLGDWIEIRLEDGNVGWISSSSVEII